MPLVKLCATARKRCQHVTQRNTRFLFFGRVFRRLHRHFVPVPNGGLDSSFQPTQPSFVIYSFKAFNRKERKKAQSRRDARAS